MMENHEENVDEEDEIVEEYVCALADFERIRNHYAAFDEDGNEIDNPAFCLNFVSSSIRDVPREAFKNCRTLADLRVQQGGRRRIILRRSRPLSIETCRTSLKTRVGVIFSRAKRLH